MVKVKRQRLSIKRNSSRTELPLINNTYDAIEGIGTRAEATTSTLGTKKTMHMGGENASPELNVATGILAPAPFLRACNRLSLGPGRDTFIYRGEFAFCSQECRQELIAKEEHKHKYERWLQTLLKT